MLKKGGKYLATILILLFIISLFSIKSISVFGNSPHGKSKHVMELYQLIKDAEATGIKVKQKGKMEYYSNKEILDMIGTLKFAISCQNEVNNNPSIYKNNMFTKYTLYSTKYDSYFQTFNRNGGMYVIKKCNKPYYRTRTISLDDNSSVYKYGVDVHVKYCHYEYQNNQLYTDRGFHKLISCYSTGSNGCHPGVTKSYSQKNCYIMGCGANGFIISGFGTYTVELPGIITSFDMGFKKNFNVGEGEFVNEYNKVSQVCDK